MGIFDRVKKIFSFSALDDDFYEELEESLILGDLGARAASELCQQLQKEAKGLKDAEAVRQQLRKLIAARMEAAGDRALHVSGKPAIILMVGVNGVGKTTTAGKLAGWLAAQNKRVLLCAGDTFRAAAGEQLAIWAERSGAGLVRQHEGADPAAVVFDALQAAKARGVDVMVCDTAGRLHNKGNLMAELGKIHRVIARECPDSRCETLLVIDAVTGQNGLMQAQQFSQSVPVTGIVLTKLDGTAKGGIAVAIGDALGVPVKLAGVGEKQEDLVAFDPVAFAGALV